MAGGVDNAMTVNYIHTQKYLSTYSKYLRTYYIVYMNSTEFLIVSHDDVLQSKVLLHVVLGDSVYCLSVFPFSML